MFKIAQLDEWTAAAQDAHVGRETGPADQNEALHDPRVDVDCESQGPLCLHAVTGVKATLKANSFVSLRVIAEHINLPGRAPNPLAVCGGSLYLQTEPECDLGGRSDQVMA